MPLLAVSLHRQIGEDNVRDVDLGAVLRHRQLAVAVQLAQPRRHGKMLALRTRHVELHRRAEPHLPHPRSDDEGDELPGLKRRLPARAGRQVRVVLCTHPRHESVRVAPRDLWRLLAEIHNPNELPTQIQGQLFGVPRGHVRGVQLRLGREDVALRRLRNNLRNHVADVVRRPVDEVVPGTDRPGRGAGATKPGGRRASVTDRHASAADPRIGVPYLAPLDEGVGLLLDRGEEPDVA